MKVAQKVGRDTRDHDGQARTSRARTNARGVLERKGHERVKGRNLSFFLSNTGLPQIRGVRQISTFREPNHLNALEGTPILLFAQDRICPSFQFAATENIKTINTHSNCTQGLKEQIFRTGFKTIRQKKQTRKEKQRTSVCDTFTVQKLFRTKTIRTDNVSHLDRGKFKCLNVVG